MRRKLNRVCECFESTTDHRIFQTNPRIIFEWRKKVASCLFARPQGNGSGRAAISPTKQVLAFGTLDLLTGSHVGLQFWASEKLGREGMVEWNRIFRLFLFSGILGQPREVHLKFRNKVAENVLSIRSFPEFPEFLVEWKAPWISAVSSLYPEGSSLPRPFRGKKKRRLKFRLHSQIIVLSLCTETISKYWVLREVCSFS